MNSQVSLSKYSFYGHAASASDNEHKSLQIRLVRYKCPVQNRNFIFRISPASSQY